MNYKPLQNNIVLEVRLKNNLKKQLWVQYLTLPEK